MASTPRASNTTRWARDRVLTPHRCVRIPDEDWNTARAVAFVRGESLSEVIRDALKQYVQRAT